MSARYAIGIDLGTTNCAVSYIDLQAKVAPGKPPDIRTFNVPQLISEGNCGDKPLFPSFLYLAGEHDLPPGSLKIPWDSERGFAVGEFARNQGAKVPGRLVSSAKSWLCHAAVDRTADILPWGGLPDVKKVSPVEASARYLSHMKEAWNWRMAGGKDELRLENQDIMLTVPASFDAVARELTVEAAKKAGLPKVTLLEEPQAAFYWWIVAHFDNWWNHVKPGQLVLVCDVGGGTTDFSLIAVTEKKGGGLGFERFAVGDHLILGGDNMDVALARRVEQRLAGGKPAKLDIVQWAGLVQHCRNAKEKLLEGDLEKAPIVLPGRGSSIIGGSLRSELTRQEVKETVIDGFFPLTKWTDEPVRTGRTGLQEFGLPYAGDPAIPRHLSNFLRKHLAGADGQGVGARGRVGAVLFNGGVFNPPVVRNRLMEVLREWMSAADPFGEVIQEGVDSPQGLNLAVLENVHLDLAVAHGAAYYGLVRKGQGIRIAGGTARSYYVGIAGADTKVSDRVEEDAPALVDRAQKRTTVLCVAPAGLEEGEEVDIADRSFELTTGRPVVFPLYSSSLRPRDKAGELLVAEDESLVPLAPIRTVLAAGKKGGPKSIPVHLQARVTEVGTLELWCASAGGERSWRLQFQVRTPGGAAAPSAEKEEGEADDGLIDIDKARDMSPVLEEERVAAALDTVRVAFGLPAKESKVEFAKRPTPQSLNRDLEEALDLKRADFPTTALRRLWEPLFEALEQRKLSPEHESRWLNLAGFSLRPGFGDPLDEWRFKRLWSIQYSGLASLKHPQCWLEWWTLWRRIAGGLSAAHQSEVFNEAGGYLHPSLRKGKGPRPGRVKPSPHELAEIWRVAGSLERLDAALKGAIGNAVFLENPKALPPKHELWALARLGARTPLYGPLNATIHHTAVERWIKLLLDRPWDADPEPVAFALSQMARMTGDRARDIDDSLRKAVLERLSALTGPRITHFIMLVAEVTELQSEDRTALYGDELPPGLRLVGAK